MPLLRRHAAMKARPWRWIVASVPLLALLCGAAAALALSPAPGTSIVNRVTLLYGDASGVLLPAASATVSVPITGAPLLHIEMTPESDPVAAGTTTP